MNKWLLKANSSSKVVKLNIKKRNCELEAKEEAKIVADARRIATQNRIVYAMEEREKWALEHEKGLQQADRDKLTALKATIPTATPTASPEPAEPIASPVLRKPGMKSATDVLLK